MKPHSDASNDPNLEEANSDDVIDQDSSHALAFCQLRPTEQYQTYFFNVSSSFYPYPTKWGRYHLRFILEAAETSQIFLRDTHITIKMT
jgi:hypothetical protein